VAITNVLLSTNVLLLWQCFDYIFAARDKLFMGWLKRRQSWGLGGRDPSEFRQGGRGGSQGVVDGS